MMRYLFLLPSVTSVPAGPRISAGSGWASEVTTRLRTGSVEGSMSLTCVVVMSGELPMLLS